MRLKHFFSFFIIIAIGFAIIACNSGNSVGEKAISIDTDSEFPADSFEFYEKALAVDSLNIELRVAIATNYYATKQFEKAIDHLLIAHQIDKKNVEILITLGNIYFDIDKYEKAIEFYKNALLLDDKNVNVRCDMATCYLNNKMPKKAYAILKKNIEIDSTHAPSHHNLSFVCNELGKTKEAEAEMIIYNRLSK